jgi:hypothetical protein
MIKCITCGTENLEGSQYCDECGADLRYSVANSENEASQPSFSESPKIQSASVTSVGVPLIIDEPKFVELIPENSEDDKLQNKNVHARLVIERGTSVGTEFQLSADESQIGRWDADNGVFPDIDLDAHDPEAKVSRRHARIIHQNDKFFVEDLGSTNGTFVNRGRRLIPGTPHLLADGDEIIVGKTFLRFHII